ncbi:hypothetical protein COU19_02060 [Candidatus Kaiserbacteria bacterium CG10_big_fil_rev_8_21_14_0_10_56_12]|uniref:Uncharacterized protein n=1 Tax=Candidatus Kaiserbacteria bacterium CG10_big_fil_rev_8_21_14_0_10_56_12 TaxID=1974611 RepID=A0A2H0U9U8_9BACT|nr:MAG: hypothetical protein COU19_02060 [Candidatus Kaiserbacteria bacterium CG10_big_fil_rev_8_21_14_0_10_56_12]
MYLKVYVVPGARREEVEEVDDTLRISVREPAQANRANVRVREIVALRYRVPLSKVTILTGHHSRGKMLVVNS